MYDSDNTGNCRRANQSELNFLTHQFNNTSAFEDMTELISKNFDVSFNDEVFDLINIDMDIYPQNFKEAIKNCRQENNPYKLLAMMILWSVYGDWITGISIFRNKSSNVEPDNNSNAHQNIIDYFKENTKNINQIESVEITCLNGFRWLMDNQRFGLLNKLIENKIKLKIIITENEIAESFCRHMRNNDKVYVSSFMPASIMWNEFYQKHSDFIKLRICPVQLLKNYYAFNMKDESKSCINVVFYTYGNHNFKKNYFQTFFADSQFYSLFKDEFNYLWNISKDITDNNK